MRSRDDRVRQFEADLGGRIEILAFTTAAAILAGRIEGGLRRAGQRIGPFDPLIAAIAIHHDRTLVTGNTEHDRRIAALGYPLRLEDWREPA